MRISTENLSGKATEISQFTFINKDIQPESFQKEIQNSTDEKQNNDLPFLESRYFKKLDNTLRKKIKNTNSIQIL